MTSADFLSLLSSIGFPQRYWELCASYPLRPDENVRRGRKEDVFGAFFEVGVTPRRYPDDAFEFEVEQIGEITWSGVFVKQRSGGVELMINGESNGTVVLGSNFAVLAHEVRLQSDPSFVRDQPYPRPEHNGDPIALREIVKQHVCFVRWIKDAIRRHAA